jgi:prepilin-type processing-associated H-X9-DG protein/prepilin-type N-terminal cleavage/methylation domain-containing protein
MLRAGGFTLVEVLVVVAIIMILAAIVYPVYEVVNKRAETVHCANNMHHIATAVALYADDHDGVLVPARTGAGPAGTLGTSWDVLLLPYHKVKELYLCLADQTPTYATSTVCYNHSYGLNLDLTMVSSTVTGFSGYNGSALGLESIDSPTQTIMFFEILGSARALGTSYPTDGLTRIDARHNDGCNFSFVDGHVKWYHPRTTCSGDHNMWLP